MSLPSGDSDLVGWEEAAHLFSFQPIRDPEFIHSQNDVWSLNLQDQHHLGIF